MAVRRKARLGFVELRPQEWDRFPAGFQREHPDTALRFRGTRRVQQETSIARPTGGILVLAGLQQKHLVFRAVRWLLIQVERAVPVGGKDNPAPIRRPDRVFVSGSSKGKA